jgi:outer membrane lipoprotein SlyB
MKKLYVVAIIFALAIVGCTSSQFATYRPAGSNEASWEINVYHTSGVSQNFKVVINDSTVIDKGANFFSGNLETKGNYRGKEIKLIVSYSSGFLGIGAGYEAMVFISNELAGKFKF